MKFDFTSRLKYSADLNACLASILHNEKEKTSTEKPTRDLFQKRLNRSDMKSSQNET